MLHFSNLSQLDIHLSFLQKKIKPAPQKAGAEDIFLVGGAIRDLLLDIEHDPTDIDLTLAGKPEKIYKNIDKAGFSHFITEKFGTITLIKKPLKKESEYKYEITPLRTEGDYDDYRHPGKINRSNDLLLDSNRRDFTINCIYYYSVQTPRGVSPKKTEMQKYTDETIIKLLDKHGFLFFADLNLYIIQDHAYISKLFPDGQFQPDFLPYLQNITKENKLIYGDEKDNRKNMSFLIDPHHGIQDLVTKTIKTVGEPDKRFGEDALRIIRGLRFPNILNSKLKQHYNHNAIHSKEFFDFQRETRQSIKKNAKLVKNVAKERIKEEIIKVFSHDNPFGFIALLDEIKLLPTLFPSLAATKNIDQPTRYHPFDIYTHSLLALFEIQKTNPDYLVKLAVLYHDVGKVGQFDAYKENLSKEDIREILAGPLNHRRSGPELVKKDFKKLGFSTKEIDTISRYVAHHHTPEEFLYAKDENKIKKLRKFLSEAGYERAKNTMDICIADRMGQYNPLQSGHDVGDVYEAIGQLEQLHTSEGQFTLKDLAIDGNDIIKTFKLKPGPDIGKFLQKAFERAMDDIHSKNNKKSLIAYLTQAIKGGKKSSTKQS